jgi:putative membrane protein
MSIRKRIPNHSFGDFMFSRTRSLVSYGSLAALAALVVPVQSTHAQSRAPKIDDPTIVAIFDAANTYDIETGGLAVKKARSKQVHEFGEMLVRDHKNVRQQGRDLAASLKVTPTPPRDFALAKAHADAMKKLRSLNRTAFDRAFLQHEIDFHNAVIDAVTKSLLPATQNAQLKDLETKVAPAFVAHRDRAQNLLDHLK